MKRFLLIICVIMATIGAQETKLPPGDICMNHAPGKNQKHVWECHCKYMCHVQPDGTIIERESQDCKSYCRHNDCTCHPEEPCPSPEQQGEQK